MSQNKFRSGVELGKFLGSIDVIPDAYQAISDTCLTSETKLTCELHTSRSGIDVLAFKCSNDYTTQFLEGKFDLVLKRKKQPLQVQSGIFVTIVVYLLGVIQHLARFVSWFGFNDMFRLLLKREALSENPQVVDFISTKVNSSFSINRAAVELFQQLGDDLKQLENKHINTPLIITGSGLGGYLANLSTLRLLHAIDVEESNDSKETKRPICITFGSPLVGDAALQSAIAERPQWKSSFLNVVAKKDPVAGYFSSNTPYKPFGTFLFCTESGDHAAFDDEDSILLVLDAMKFSNEGDFEVYDYMKILNSVRRKVLYRGVSESGESNLNLLREVGVLDCTSNDKIAEMEKKQIEMIESKNAESDYEVVKRLNEMKKSLIYMEWYMKTRKQEHGYYDSYKNPKTRDEIGSKNTIVIHQGRLNQYWKEMVEEKDQAPQKEGATLRKRWLYGGTNYRRIVEPLDIAEYYKNGNIDYIKNRLEHYKLLEKWADEDRKNTQNSSDEKRNKAASLTEDSCFWAHVEEALISLQDIATGGSGNKEKELEQFEAYVMRAINDNSVSPDIFAAGSSLMEWWKKYKAYKGTAYASEFAKYMNNESYKLYK